MAVKAKHFLVFGAPAVALFMFATVILQERKREASLQLRLSQSQEKLQAAERFISTNIEHSGETIERDGVTITRGVLPQGSDLGQPRMIYVHEAIDLCRALPECIAFTFRHDDDKPKDPVLVYLKTASKVDRHQTSWCSYEVRTEHPAYHLLTKYLPFIKADYDFEAIAKYGPELSLNLWPEFRVPKQMKAAFSYPADTAPAIPLSMAPRVYLLPDFISTEVASGIVDAARKKLHRSKVARGVNEQGKSETDQVRTSSGAWLDDGCPEAKMLRDHIEKLSGVRRGNFEMLQILRYEKGQKYGAHVDYFHPAAYGKQNWNRMATVITFLTNVTAGGESAFPTAHNTAQNGKDCSHGLRVTPYLGTAVLFYSMRRNYNFDPFSLHSGCPVEGDDEKWVAVQWLRLDLPENGPQPRN